MSVAIQIQLPPESVAMVQRFKAMPQEFPRAIKRGMDKALLIVSGRIIERRLSGKGPFPVEEHRLGQVTQRLARSTRSTPATIDSTGETVQVTGAIGSDVFYAKIHEFGGKKAPERAPFRTGINENVEYITEQIQKEITATFERK